VVIGGSAGAVEALTRVVRGLPGDLPAPVFVVVHLPAHAESRLHVVLGRAGSVPAEPARDGEVPQNGRIYVAPPDRHLVIHGGRLSLVEGPRENSVRPAIDPLFRSAAAAYGPRLIAVVLSGSLDDGTAGLADVAAAGGTTIVQDPADALVGGMPGSAIEHVEVDHIATAPAIAGLIVDSLRRRPRPSTAADRVRVGPHIDLVCPDCGGVLRIEEESGVIRFACRVGHAYSPESLFGAQELTLEAALWTAIRSLDEAASLSRRLAETARNRGLSTVAERFDERQEDAARRADLVRTAVLSLGGLDEMPGEAAAEPDEPEDEGLIREDASIDHDSTGAA